MADGTYQPWCQFNNFAKQLCILYILFDQCMKAVGFQCNVARCAVGVISLCVKVLNVFMFLVMFFFYGYFIHLKNFTAPFTYHTAEDELVIRCCVNDYENKVSKLVSK